MDWMEWLAALFLGGWLAVSALYQTKRVTWVNRLKYRDLFALIPSWTFFAPNPGTTDTNLLYRDRLQDGSTTVWREVRWESRFTRFLWNPNKRLQKGITDMARGAQQAANTHREHAERLLIDPSFLGLLNFVSHLEHSPLTERTQFCVARSYGADATQEASVEFVSNFHRIEEANG